MMVDVKKLGANDIKEFLELICVFEDVFEMEDFEMPSQDHLKRLLSKSSFMVFVAKVENEVVGGLMAYVLDQYYSEKPRAYIYDLAVLSNYQRQGIGKKLIAGINGYCNENGFEEVYVQADQVDDHAISFYHSTPFDVKEDVAQFSYFMK
ncbi:MAG: GNAT family N-acetyltransferase [Bacteroidota bacterium]